MSSRVKLYVAIVCAAAAMSVAATYVLSPVVPPGWTRAAAALACLGLAFQLGAYHLARKGASGTIAFLPYLASVLLAPSWISPITVTVAVAVSEVFAGKRRDKLKVVFNVAQYCLATAFAALVYHLLGGESLLERRPFEWTPFVVCCVLFIATNTLSVAIAIGLSQGRNVFSVWRENTEGTIGYDVMSLPMIYGSALIYVNFDLFGLVVLGLLLLGARQLYSTNRLLEATNRELLEVMVAAIEARDPYTSGHSLRVSRYSQIIARALGLRRRDVEKIRIAALLHDVGKIDQRFADILQKPGRLTEEERRIIELHPIKSAELVAMVSQLEHAVAPVRHHHENWDGTGYPDRVAGEAIPLASRIIMFADTIDAMTTDRPYRRGLGPDEVRAELVRMRGKQFDPNICDVLVHSPLFDEIFRTVPERQPEPLTVGDSSMVAA
jgi:putative nucleotidyltransferase with HDIG domain